MTTPLQDKPLPPGNRYFPVIGETFAFLGDSFGFIERQLARHGPVFRTNILGRTTVVLAGPKVSHAFIDEKLCTRNDAIPDNVRELLGGRNVAVLDGAEHRTRKGHILTAFLPEALPSYVPVMEQLVRSALTDWSARGEVRATDELQRLAIAAIARNLLSVAPGPELDQLLSNFRTVVPGFTALPIPLPGTTYSKALKARDELFKAWRRFVTEHRAKSFDDGLARILEHRSQEGAVLADDDAAAELHHIFIAGYIVFVELAAVLVRLTENPELRDALAEEASAIAGVNPLTARVVGSLPLSSRFVQETKRVTRVVPVSFGCAKTTFELNGFLIPEGTRLLWAIHAHNQDPATFTHPEVFDPERFSDARAEHRRVDEGFAPQGMGAPTGHKCPGTDYATLFMQVFATVLAREFAWTFPDQDFRFARGSLPPVHVDGLRVAMRSVKRRS